ncbi:MAG: hypothetical protein QOJ40_641 [Verrucomicrobiota bacterium]
MRFLPIFNDMDSGQKSSVRSAISPWNVTILSFICLCLIASHITAAPDPQDTRADLDYLPSRLYAVIFRNWDIVPITRLASVLGTDPKTISEAGKAMGLKNPPALTPEEIRRNVEMVLRRNWPLLPQAQIEALLGYTSKELTEFLSKEIFLRALLAAQPEGLTELKYTTPDARTSARLKWFGAHVRKHLGAVAPTPEEPRLAYIGELCRAHHPADSIPGAKPNPGDTDMHSGWRISIPSDAGEVLKTAAADFSSYCSDIHHAKLKLVEKGRPAKSKILSAGLAGGFKKTEGYSLAIEPERITLLSGSEVGLSRGLIELERRMGERGGPFLAPTRETNQPAFSPRYVSSYFSLLTDVLGQGLINPFPDGYLRELAHQDADGVWVYTLLQDLVPSPVFEGMGVGGEARLERLRDLVNRARKYGLKVYVYLNEPRAQFLPFFDKYPGAKGQVEGNTAALCTSTELVQQHLRGSFETLFRQVPGLGGVFVITASENLANCYSHTRNTSCPRCSKRSPADVIAESIRCMAEGAWAASPEAKFIVWDWSWHAVLGEEVPEKIIEKLPPGVALMADFERGTAIQRGGIPLNVEEYAISVIGPSPRAKLRSGQAKEHGFDYMAKIQLSTTWECGTVPFIPVPNLLFRKAVAMRDVGVSGAMATWTIGSYPSPDTEAFALANWNPALAEDDALRRIAARRYGPGAVESAARGWTKLSEVFTKEFPYSTSPYAGPLQHGPSLPLYRRDIPPPFGGASLFNSKDDWTNWTYPYSPELMTRLLRHLCGQWDEGLKDLKEVVAKAAPGRRRIAERDLGVAWMVGYTYRAYANALEFYKARDAGDSATMRRIATEEIPATEETLRRVRADSRLGWEAELQYFYRPLDVLERLLSLDAVIDPPP